ncbi:MAG TPA: hypothetical protein VIL30_21080 [Ramlibacter sp.]|jgi:colicin import membrane protein
MNRRAARLVPLVLAALLAACDRQDEAEEVVDGVRQTALPGHVRAGGRTSGQVMAAAAAGKPADRGPAGTPGIPGGSEGNTGGTALGGTTAATAGGAAAPPPAAPVVTEAQRAEVALAASMDTVATRWRARAAAQGWPVNAATPVDPMGGIQASGGQAAPSGQPQGQLTAAGAAAPITSEKHGTAAPSSDVKQATKPATDPSVKARAPDAAN